MAKYTDQQKAAFVALLFGQGYPENRFAIEAVRKQYNGKAPSGMSLRKWFHEHREAQEPEKIELLRLEKDNMAETFERIVFGTQKLIIDALESEDVYEMASLRDLAIIGGTAFDKWRLLRGESTDNSAMNINIRYDEND